MIEDITIRVSIGKEVMYPVAKNRKKDINKVAVIGVPMMEKMLKSTYFLAIKMVTMEEVAIIPVA